MIQSITFGDKNTREDWHIIATSRPVFAPPEVKTKYVDIPGGNGSLDLSEALTKYPVYENRKGSFQFIVENGYKDWASRYSEIMNYLHGQSMRAILEDDKSWFYQGRFSVESWESANTWSVITIAYEVSPFKWSLQSSTEPWLWDPFNFETGIIWDNTFGHITIDSESEWFRMAFDARFFGLAPIAPTINVTGAPETGIDMRFVNTYLEIDETINLKNGSTFVPDFIYYGQIEPYEMYFRGIGEVSIDFRVGRL